jgi:error-prone DNA polymerase
VTTNFTFLTGASHPEELVTRAAELGLVAIAITDRNSLAGVVRAYSALKELRRLSDEPADHGAAIRSHARTDPSSRKAHAPETPVPVVQSLPRLIIGARLVLTAPLNGWPCLRTWPAIPG